MKHITFVWVALIACVTLFSCESDEANLLELDQLNVAIQGPEKTNYSVTDEKLVFLDMETLFSTQDFILNNEGTVIDLWEKSIGFKSLRRFRNESEEELSDLAPDLIGYYGIIDVEGQFYIGSALHKYDEEKVVVEFTEGDVNGRSEPLVRYYSENNLNQANARTTFQGTIASCKGENGSYRVFLDVYFNQTTYFDALRTGKWYVNDYLRARVKNQRKGRRRWRNNKTRWLRIEGDYSVSYNNAGTVGNFEKNNHYERRTSNDREYVFSLFEAYQLPGRYGLYNNNVTVLSVDGTLTGRAENDRSCTVSF